MSNPSREYEMSNHDPKRLIVKYSLPPIIGMLINSLYNTVDRFWVGRIHGIGQASLAGIGLTAPIMNVILGLSMLIGIGAATSISIRLGRSDKDGAEQVVGNAVSYILIIAAAFTIIGLSFMRQILTAIGTTTETMPYALSYLRIIVLGSVFGMSSFAVNHTIRATGNSARFAMTQMVGGICNMILDPIFIFVFDMGIAGAAIATIISQALSTTLVFSYYFGKKTPLRLHIRNLKPRLDILKDITSIGVSPFIMQIMGSLIMIVVNRSMHYYGEKEFGPGGGVTAISAMTIILSISMLIYMPVFGINQGTQPIIGFNYGRGDYVRLRASYKWSVIYSMVIMTFGFIMIQLFAPQLISIFNSEDPFLIQTGSIGMRVHLCMLPLVGFMIPTTNFFQAIGRAKISILLNLLRQVIILIPIYLLLPLLLGFSGLWFAGPIADFISTLITAAFIRREFSILSNTMVKEGVN